MRPKYNKGGEIDPPKGNMTNQQLAMWLRKMITNKTPISEIGSPVSSSQNYVGDVDDGGFVTIDNTRSHYNDDGSVTFNFGKYDDGENMRGMSWFGTPVKTNKYGEEYIDPITIYPLEEIMNIASKKDSEPEPLKVDTSLPEIYSRKMDASGTKAVYETSKGTFVTAKDPAVLSRLMRNKNLPSNSLNIPPMLDSDFQRLFAKQLLENTKRSR